MTLVSSYSTPKRFMDTDPGVLLILARHGATEANDATVPLVRAWSNIPLDEHGMLEAQLLGNKLKKYGIKKIVHSDFMRDSQTSHIIANIVITNDIETDYDLRTWDVGSFSGKPTLEVNPAIEELYKNPWKYPPGSTESFNDFSVRCISCLEKWMNLASIDAFRPLLLVAHGKNIALAKTYIDGGNAWESFMPKPGGYSVIGVGMDRALTIDMIPPIESVIEDI